MQHLIFGGDEAGHASFESASVVVIPAPYEHTVSYGGGTGQGPEALLRASWELEFFDEELARPYWDAGAVHTLPPLELPTDPRAAIDTIRDAVARVAAAGKFPLAIGGEHSITSGPVEALREASSEPFGVLWVDAHLDLRSEFTGTPWSHASVARRLHESGGHPMAWAGIRSVSKEEYDYLGANRDLVVAYAHEIDAGEAWIDRVLESLPERVYFSFDVDGLDPSLLPGTGTPEPGGLLYRQVLRLIRRLAAEKTIIGADVVELAPIPHQQVSEFTAAKLTAKLIGSVLT